MLIIEVNYNKIYREKIWMENSYRITPGFWVICSQKIGVPMNNLTARGEFEAIIFNN